MERNEVLLTPGPTHVPQRIFDAMRQPTLHHRTETFKEFFLSAQEGIQWLTRSATAPIFLASSGTGAMEASLLNTCTPGDSVLVLNAGKFGERWARIAERIGARVVELKAAVGESIPLPEIEAALAKGSFRAICLQSCDTSTTVALPVQQICELAKRMQPNIITVVDAVSALGTRSIHLDSLAVDILVSAGHKGLMLTPGLSILVMKDHVWERINEVKPPTLYFDLKLEKKALAKNTTAWTPAMNHIVALAESIRMIREEGEENVYKRHSLMAAATRSAFQSMGLEIMAKNYPDPAVTGVYMPEGADAELIRKQMLKKHAVRVAGGQEELQGKVLRFGHMGYCQPKDIAAGITALEATLLEMNVLRNEVNAGARAEREILDAIDAGKGSKSI